MSELTRIASAALLLSATVFAADPVPAAPKDAGITKAVEVKAVEKPFTELPYSPSLDLKDMDPKVDPCVDFYQYSCGGWIAANPIPADRASMSVYGKLTEDTTHLLWGMLEEASAPSKTRSPVDQKIGDYFAACMDEAAIEKAGLTPLKAQLAQVDKLSSVKGLAALLGALHPAAADMGLFFHADSAQDYGNSSRVIAFVNNGGLSLPDRDYYTKDDARSVELRAKYLSYIETTLAQLGSKPDAVKADAARVLALETTLAKASLTRVEKRDPHNLHHLLTFKELTALTPSFDWAVYFKGIGLSLTEANVTEPKFFEAFEAELKKADLATLKLFLKYHLLRSKAASLAHAYADPKFDFFAKTLRGIEAHPPRWKQCTEWVDGELGEALAQAYVKKTFSPEVKARTVEMTRRIEQAMEEDLDTLTWMSPATKKAALEKLHAIRNKVGYPDAWRDYSSVAISRTDLFGNREHTSLFEAKRQLAKIGKPLDRGEWGMTPPTVNAYYDAQMNDINFPAGVLQPPLFDFKMDEAPNYGNTGSTIGHELTHGFDDEGRQFDGAGNLRDWWTEADAKNFESRAQCVVDQYAGYVIVDDIKINSKLTLGEDVADLGGTVLAYMAWKKATVGQKLDKVDGLSPDQRFFVGLAQWACENTRPESLRVSAVTNPHSPGKYRINGVVSNMPEFKSAFACKPAAPMVRAKPCRVW
jgi:endothelin-converting enzyme/putative endopeptidase